MVNAKPGDLVLFQPYNDRAQKETLGLYLGLREAPHLKNELGHSILWFDDGRPTFEVDNAVNRYRELFLKKYDDIGDR